MRQLRRIQVVLAILAAVGICLPVQAMAASPAPAMTDVALQEGGILVGQVLDPQGLPKSDLRVAVQDVQNREVAAATTDPQGRFAVRGLGGGVYQMVTRDGRVPCRLWLPGTAPPVAQPGALLVSGTNTVRGAGPGGGLKFWLTNPLVIAGVIATAIAVPVALSNHHPSSP